MPNSSIFRILRGESNTILSKNFKEKLDSIKPERMEPGYYMRANGSFFELTHDNKIVEHGK